MRRSLFRGSCPFHRSRGMVLTRNLRVKTGGLKALNGSSGSYGSWCQGRPGPLRPPCGGQFYYGNRRHYDGGKSWWPYESDRRNVHCWAGCQVQLERIGRPSSARSGRVCHVSIPSASRLPANCGTRNKPISSWAERQTQWVDDAATAMSIER